MIRKLFLPSLLIFALFLAACGGGAADEETPADADTETEATAEEAESDADAGPETITVTFGNTQYTVELVEGWTTQIGSLTDGVITLVFLPSPALGLENDEVIATLAGRPLEELALTEANGNQVYLHDSEDDTEIFLLYNGETLIHFDVSVSRNAEDVTTNLEQAVQIVSTSQLVED